MVVYVCIEAGAPSIDSCWNHGPCFFRRRREQTLMLAERVFGSRELAELWYARRYLGLRA